MEGFGGLGAMPVLVVRRAKSRPTALYEGLLLELNCVHENEAGIRLAQRLCGRFLPATQPGGSCPGTGGI